MKEEENKLRKLLDLLDKLEEANISYRLEHVRDSIMIRAFVPGELWEIEFFDDDHVEIERFLNTGVTREQTLLDELITLHGS